MSILFRMESPLPLYAFYYRKKKKTAKILGKLLQYKEKNDNIYLVSIVVLMD